MRPAERGMRTALLCRWALLACLAGMALWACTVTAISVEREPPAVLAVSDGVFGPGGSIILRAWHAATGGPPGQPQVMALVPDAPTFIMYAEASSDCIYLPAAKTYKAFTIEGEGIPYGPLAFARGLGRVLVLPTDRPVYVVEASLLADALQADPGAVAQFFDEVLRRGVAVCCNTNAYSPLGDLQNQLRRLAPEVRVVHSPNRSAMHLAVSIMKRWGGRNTFLVTGSAALAADAAKQGFVAYLIDPNASDASDARLLPYPSLESLTKHFRDDRVQVDELRRQAPSDATSVP